MNLKIQNHNGYRFCLLALIMAHLTTLGAPNGWAMGAGSDSTSIGIIGGISRSDQTDLNALRSRANERANGISTAELNEGLEVALILQQRIPSSLFALQLRPSFFTQEEEGRGGSGAQSGNYKYATDGSTVAGLFKLYALENSLLHLFFQGGVVWGTLNTQIQEAAFEVEAKGSNLGYIVGAGIDFCSPPHCLILEANMRFLTIERSLVTSQSGTPAANSVSQYGKDEELEYDSKDLIANMSGLQTFVGYTFNF